MAYADYATYKAQYTNPQVFSWGREAPTTSTTSQVLYSLFSKTSDNTYPTPRGGASVVAAPTTALACDADTTGAMIRPIAGSGDQCVVSSIVTPRYMGIGGWLLADRLSHQGGLSGTVTTTQTTNLPTAALTRYTSGVGVYAALEFYGAAGGTDAVWTVVYTNEAGTGSRSVTFTLTNTPTIQSFIVIPLQGTDSGVRSVESVALTPSTGTAGNFGVTLFKPLVWLPPTVGYTGRPVDVFDMPGWNTPILDAACLQLLIIPASSVSISCGVIMGFGES